MANKKYKELTTHIGLMLFLGIVCLALVGAYFYFIPTFRSSLSIIINPIDADNANLVKSDANLKGALSKLDLSQYQSADGVSYKELSRDGKLNPKVIVKTTGTSSIIKITVVDSDMNFAYDYVNAISANIQNYLSQIASNSQVGKRGNLEAQIEENLNLLTQTREKLAKSKTDENNTKIQNTIEDLKTTISEKSVLLDPLADEIETIKNTIPSYFVVMAPKSDEINAALAEYVRIATLYEEDAETFADTLAIKEQDLRNACYEMTASNEVSDALVGYLTKQARYDILQQMIADSTQMIADNQAKIVELQQLESNVASYEAIVISLRQKLEESKISDTSVVLEVEPAELDDSLFTTDRIIAAAAALVLGLILGFVIGLLKDVSNLRVVHESTARELLNKEVDCLGWIPYERTYETIKRFDSRASGRYRLLANSINILLNGSGAKTIAVISPKRYEGKTTTIINLATNLAMMGKKVLVVDADLTNHAVEDAFRVGHNKFGLTDVVMGKAIKEEAIVKPVEGLSKLNMICAGTTAENSNVIFTSEPFTVLMNEFKNMYDYVLVDSARSDFMLISHVLDVCLLNVRAGVTTVPALADFNDQRRAISVPIIGFIFYGKILNKKEGDATYDVYNKATRGERIPRCRNAKPAELAFTAEQKKPEPEEEKVAEPTEEELKALKNEDEKPIVL